MNINDDLMNLANDNDKLETLTREIYKVHNTQLY